MGRPEYQVIVVGAGIGGLALAAGLAKDGHRVRVLEQAPEPRSLGAGLIVAPNGMKALHRLGLVEAVQAAGARLDWGEIRAWNGRLLSRAALAGTMTETGGAPVGIRRAALHDVLLGAVDAEGLRLGARCVGFEQDDAGVTVTLQDGSQERAELLVGADGIHSAVRARLLGDGAPRYAGYTCWRGIARFSDPAAPVGGSIEGWGSGRRFGMVDVGEGYLYWFATRNAPAGATRELAHRPALLDLFGGWYEPVERLIRATPDDVIIQNDIEDRPPIREWGRGRVTLLGDAAHPTTPNLGQGASLALEDGTVLRWCLRVAADPIAALRAYEERRWRRTAAVTRMSWSLGRVAQLENGLARRLRDELVRLTPEWLSRRQYSRLTAFDIEGLPTSRSHLEDAH